MANLEEEFYDNSHVLIFTNLDDIGQPYSCNQWGNRHVQYGSENPIITNDSGSTIWGWFRSGAYVPSYAWIDHTMTVYYKSNYLSQGSNKINQMLDNCGALCSQDPVPGCTDNGACNYNQSADLDDGTCEYESCIGCTDPLADNYDSNASIDDDSCIYPVNISFGQITASTIDIMLSNSYDIQGFQFTVTDIPDEITITDCYGGRAEEVGFEVSSSELGIVIGFSFDGSLIPIGDGLLTTLIYDGIGPTDICFEDVIVSDSNAESLGTGISDCVLLDIIAFPGDTNLDELINVQDIVVIINFILGFSDLSEQQFVNGDMDENGILNILDVIRIVNQILGLARTNDFQPNNIGVVNIERIENDMILSLYSEVDYSGVQLMINSPYDFDVILKDNSHIILKDNYINGQKRVLAYSMFNDIFDGHKAEFTIEDGANFSLDDIKIIVSDTYGNEIATEYHEIDANFDYSFSINSIYPNPFNPSTDIDFSMPNNGYVILSVYNIKGQKVDVIFEGYQDSGFHSYTWNASEFPSGIYYFNLELDNKVSVAKAMLIK